jgi:hypothetical protein
MAEQFDSKYFRGQGALLIGTRGAGGGPEGLIFVGDLESVSLEANVQRGEVIENVSGSRGVGSSWLTRASFNLQIGMRSIKPEHLAQALQGTATALASATVSDEPHVARLGRMSPLAHTQVSAVTVTDDAGVTTYAEGVGNDYILHAEEGLIEFLTGGAITEGQAVLVDYTHADQHRVTANPSNAERYLVFAGKNSADNDKQTRVEIYKAKLDPGVHDLISEEAASATISGLVELDTLRPAGDQFFAWVTED